MFEDLRPFIVFDQYPPLLSGNDPDHVGVRIAEAVEHACNGVAERFVQEPSPVSAEQVRAGVFVGHALALMVNTISAVIVFEVVLKAVEDSGQILGLLPVAEGDQLEQRVEGQRRERQCWAAVDAPSGGHSARPGRSRPC